MKFSVLALDYDGTIAEEGVLDPEVRAAIADVRAQGITVVIVSGRVLADLRHAVGDLWFVDAVVAENGAVLCFSNGHSRLLASPPPASFLAELKRRGITFSAGQCIVEADASCAQSILAVIRELHPEVRRAIDIVVATGMTDPRSLDALLAMCGGACSRAELTKIIEGMTINEAAILPGPATGGKLLPFELLPRLTPHVRHRVKYFDVSVGEGRGFVFTSNSNPVGARACSLREFVSALNSLPPAVLDGHAKRGDFACRVLDVFRDHPLSSRIRKVEEQYCLGHIGDLRHARVTLVRERYDLPSNLNVPG
jgi:hypothetical protein